MTKTLVMGRDPWMPPVATFLSKVKHDECLVAVDIYIQDEWDTIEHTVAEASRVTGKHFVFSRNQLVSNKIIPVTFL